VGKPSRTYLFFGSVYPIFRHQRIRLLSARVINAAVIKAMEVLPQHCHFFDSAADAAYMKACLPIAEK
jgi:protein-L-isoaspartate O-methyltransferase